jgi:hypothetical protein
LVGTFSFIFCRASANTDGVGEADGDGEELVVGTGAGSALLVSDGTGLKTGVGFGSALVESEGIGEGEAELAASGEAEIVGVARSGPGEFSSAKVGATLAKTKATTIKKINRVASFPFRVERRSRISEEFSRDIRQIVSCRNFAI